MSGCGTVQSRLVRYAEEALADAERAAVEAHLGGCAACRAEIASLRETIGRLQGARGLAPELIERLARGFPELPERIAGEIRKCYCRSRQGPGAVEIVTVTAGSIAGMVRDRAGCALAHAPVELERDGKKVRAVFADAAGRFAFEGLVPGDYRVLGGAVPVPVRVEPVKVR